VNHSPSFKNLVLLAQGQFVTSIGSRVFDVAMLLWIKQVSDSAALMGLAMLFSTLPATLLAPFGGALADRLGRLRVIIGSDLISAGIVGVVLVAFLSQSDPAVVIAALCLGNLVLGLSGATFGPAVNALIPTLVPESRLERANAVFRFSQTGGGAIGQGLGGLLFATIGFAGTIAVNAVSFALSALSESWIRLPADKTEIRQPAPLRIRALWTETLATTRALLSVRRTRALLVMIAAFHLCFASLPITLPYYVERVLGLDPAWFGPLMAALSIGILIGFVVVGLMKPARNRLGRAALFAFAVALVFGSLAVVPSVPVAALALGGIGAGIGIIIVTLMTELQVVAPEAERAAAMGAAQAVGDSSIPIGMALSGLMLDALMRLELPADLPIRYFVGAAATLAALAALTGVWGMRK